MRTRLVGNLKTVLPWKEKPLVASDGSLLPAQVSLVQYGTLTCLVRLSIIVLILTSIKIIDHYIGTNSHAGGFWALGRRSCSLNESRVDCQLCTSDCPPPETNTCVQVTNIFAAVKNICAQVTNIFAQVKNIVKHVTVQCPPPETDIFG